MAYKSTSSRLPYQGEYLLESVEGATKFTSQVHLEPSLLWRLASANVKPLGGKQLIANLDRLEDMLEM